MEEKTIRVPDMPTGLLSPLLGDKRLNKIIIVTNEYGFLSCWTQCAHQVPTKELSPRTWFGSALTTQQQPPPSPGNIIYLLFHFLYTHFSANRTSLANKKVEKYKIYDP